MNRNKKIRAGVLLSGGLDSLLAVKIMQEQGVDVFALFFKLPFSVSLENGVKKFSKEHKVKLKILDCTKGKLLKEYLEMVRRAKNGRGVGFNPCIDCRIFLFKRAKEFVKKEKLDFLVTGEVLEERPMSQKQKIMRRIDEESGLKEMVLRPLSAKLLEETNAEKYKLVNRDAFFDIRGKRRVKQIELAKKYEFSYPNPAGGCLLCEKNLKKRFKIFFAREELWNYFYLWGVGRHFFIGDNWIILGRNEKENMILEKVKEGFLVTPAYVGPSILVFGKIKKSLKEKIEEMIRAYSKKGSLNERKVFEKYKV